MLSKVRNFVLFVLWVSVLLIGSGASGAVGNSALEGQLAPDFTLTALDGQTVRLSALAGKPVFLNFWATWCPPCRMEMPDMEALHQSLGDRIAIVGINQGEPAEAVEEFVRENGYTWQFVADEKQAVGEIYGLTAYPTSIFIDAEGRITGRRVGMLGEKEMEVLIREAMGSGNVAFKEALDGFVQAWSGQTVLVGSEVNPRLAVLELEAGGDRTHRVYVRPGRGDGFEESRIFFRVPSLALDVLPVSELGEVLLRWNLDYEIGAWAVDPHNGQLTFVAKFYGSALDDNTFQRVCGDLVRTVDAFEREVRRAMEIEE